MKFIPLTRPPVRLLSTGTFPLPGTPGATYTIGHDAVMDYHLDQLPDTISVDIEGAGKDGRKKYDVKAVQFGTRNHALIFDPRVESQFGRVREIVNSGRALVFHNSTYDVPILYLIGLLDLKTVWNVEDTLIWARGAEPDERSRKNLLSAANRYLDTNIQDPLPDLLKVLGISKEKWFMNTDLDTPAYRYMAASDAIATARLRDVVRKAFYERLTSGHPFSTFGVTGEEAWRLVDREQIQNRIHLTRQCPGYIVDPEYLDEYRKTTAKDIHTMAAQLEAEGVTPGNANTLTEYLEKGGHLPEKYPRTKKTGKLSGKKEDLETLDHPLARVFVKQKELEHIDRDYLSKVMENADPNGRIHPGTNLLGAATGRMSISGDAPLHQFSGPARGIILADNWEEAQASREHDVLVQKENGDWEAPECNCKNPKGLVSVDWSQIEPVLVANIAGDKKAIDYYEAGNKFYDAVATHAGINYKTSKTVLLAQLYGEGIKKLAGDLKTSIEGARDIINQIWMALPATQKLVDKPWKGGKLQSIAEKHQMIFTLSGRIVPVPSGYWPCWNCEGTGHLIPDNEDSPDCDRCQGKGTKWTVATHKGVNYFVQGGAYDLLAEAEIAIHEAGLSDAIYLAMHDELIMDAAAARDIQKIMSTPPERLCWMAKRTPILRTDSAHMGERWASV